MKTQKIVLTAIFVTLSLSSVNAQSINSLLQPNPVYAAMFRPYGEIFASIYLGDFPSPYTPADVDQLTLLINGTHTPAIVEITQHSVFEGDVLKLSVPIQDFVGDYYPFFSQSFQEFTVTGEFLDDTPFNITGSFTAIGHDPGDINLDGAVNNRDLVFMINRIFRNGPAPEMPELADVNGSCGNMNIHDLNYMVNFIFREGPAPTICPNN